MISFEIPSSLESIDSDLEGCNWALVPNIKFDPIQLKQFESHLLYESATIQWMLTRWRQIKQDSPIEIDSNEVEVDLLTRLADSMPGALLALLPNGKIRNVSRRSTAFFGERFFVNQQNWPDLDVSESSSILCLDSNLQGLPKQLYPNGSAEQLTDWGGFRKVIDGLIKSVASESDTRGKINDRADRLSTIIFELFKNTHDHARYAVDGKIISDSVRGLYTRFYPIEKLKSVISSKKEESLNQAERYVHLLMQSHSQSQLKSPQRNLTGFLEISIFDSGPGLAAKWLRRDVSGFTPQEQLAAVMECFGKGRSSLSSSSRGFGLWKVLEELKQLKGMIRVRTNRVHALRQYAILENLYRDQHVDGYSSPQVVMLDWRRGFTQKLSDYPSIEGTLISVLLPLGDL